MRSMLVLLIALTGWTSGSDRVLDRTTPASQSDQATCGREPRTVEDLRRIAPPPPSGPVIPTAIEDLPTELPSGAPVDAETVSRIRAMMDEQAACFLDGDELAGLAYLTDGFLRTIGSLSEENLDRLATTTPTPEPDPTFYSIEDVSRVERLDDGRVGAIVTAGGACERSQPEPTCTFYLLFLEQDGQWFIDDQIRFLTTSDRSEFLTVPEYLARETPQVVTPGT